LLPIIRCKKGFLISKPAKEVYNKLWNSTRISPMLIITAVNRRNVEREAPVKIKTEGTKHEENRELSSRVVIVLVY
jgi:hypothetical protein